MTRSSTSPISHGSRGPGAWCDRRGVFTWHGPVIDPPRKPNEASRSPDPHPRLGEGPDGMRLPGIAACLVLAAAAVLPFRPWSAYRESPWRFEARVESDQSGLVQL